MSANEMMPELDAWLAVCSPEERALTARWLADGSGADQIPKPLKAAQERLMQELADQPQAQGA